MILIFPFICIIRASLLKSDAERIHAIQHGVRGTAVLWNCPYCNGNPGSRGTYDPVFSFLYDGKALYREVWGTYTEPPCNIGDTMNVVYCAETNCLVLIDERVEKIYAIQHGVKGTAKLCNCPDYEGGLSESLKRMYRPEFSFLYDGNNMCIEAIGTYYEPPCSIGDVVEIVYCAETDCLVLVDEDYNKYKNPSLHDQKRSAVIDALL
jgi:hypothetical protein